MTKLGRTAPGVKKARWAAMAEILADNPNISDVEMQKKLKKRGIDTTRQTIHSDRKHDLESMTLDDIKNTKSAMLREIDVLIAIAYARAKSGESDALRAMDKYDKLFNTKAKVLAIFEQAKLAKISTEKPIINVTIGKPKLYQGDKKDEKTTE